MKIYSSESFEIRCLHPEDSISELTTLLHKAYKTLADMGLNYVAASQDDAETLKRISSAESCFIGLHQGKIIATLSLYKPKASKCEWYNQKNVAKLGQFAVMPEHQKCGIGNKLMALAEEKAGTFDGVTELALDTAESADHLIAYYEKRGYRRVDKVQWTQSNYPSVILSKTLECVV